MVVVEMVAGQIGKHANINRQAIQSPLIQRVTGGFKRHALDPVITPLSQPTVKCETVRCGIACLGELLIEPHTQRTDCPGLAPRTPQQLGG